MSKSARARRTWPATGVQLVRAAWGAVLLTRPEKAYGILGGAPPSTSAGTTVLRVLGGRHVAQAAVALARPTRPVLVTGAVFDALHALTAVAYAASGESRRRTGLTDTAFASGLALATVSSSRTPD